MVIFHRFHTRNIKDQRLLLHMGSCNTPEQRAGEELALVDIVKYLTFFVHIETISKDHLSSIQNYGSNDQASK